MCYCTVAKRHASNFAQVQEAPPKGGDAQMSELPLHSLLHREHVDADKGARGGDTSMRDRSMGMACVGCVFLSLSWNTFPRLPLPCECVGLAAKQLQVRRRKEVDCLQCYASFQHSPGQEPALASQYPQRKKLLQLFTLFSLLLPTSVLKS